MAKFVRLTKSEQARVEGMGADRALEAFMSEEAHPGMLRALAGRMGASNRWYAMQVVLKGIVLREAEGERASDSEHVRLAVLAKVYAERFFE